MSASSVPFPGPSSTSLVLEQDLERCHLAMKKMASNSPNTWLISGLVIKSPRAPSTCREDDGSLFDEA